MRPVSPKLPKRLDRQHVPVALTARKSIAAKPAFLLTASKPNGIRLNGSAQPTLNRVVTNGSHLSPKSSILRQIHPEPPETPSRKRQRMTSPGNDEFSPRISQRNFDLPSKERSPPYGNPPSRNFGSPLPNGSNGHWLPDKDKGRVAAAQAPRLDTNFTQPPPSEVNFDPGPATTPARNSSSNDVRKTGLGGSFPEPTILSQTDWRSPSARNSLAPERQGRGPGPAKAKKHQKVAKSAYRGLGPVIRSPPLEKQRQHLTESHDISALDSFIYCQEGSSQPPPGVMATAQHEPPKRGDIFYGYIDPRTHWTRPRSDEWYQKKEEEIKARGGRKANFGKAAQRIREQRLKESPYEWEENLPDRVRNDEAWLGALRFHHSRTHGVQMTHTPLVSEQKPPVRKKRAYRIRNQGLIPPVVTESSGAGARLDSQTSNAGPGLRLAASTNANPRLQKKQTGTSI